MTLAELNRHMKRRFDRLERTKADKRDLLRYATKKDLQRFSVDIKRYFGVVAEGLEEKLQKVADGVAQIAAVQLHVAHHDKVLDEHETRIRALDQSSVTDT